MDKYGFIKKNGIYIFFSGFFLIMYLVYDDPQESIFIIISLIALIKSSKNASTQTTFTLFSVFVVFIALAYIVVNIFLLTQRYNMELNNINPLRKLEKTAVLVVYEGEPERYNLSKCLTNIKCNKDISEKILTPFLLNKNKNNYKKIGKSDYKKNTDEMKNELQQVLDENYKVYVSYMNDSKYIEECLIDIVNDGYHNVIVVPMVLTDGHTLQIIKARIEKMKLFNLNINIKYVEPLWNNNAIAAAYTKTIEKYINKNGLTDIGILLIGEGEKGYNRGNHIGSAKENLMLRNKIKSYLISDLDIEENKIKTAWFNYIQPNYIDTIDNLLEYGVGNILIVYVKPSATNIDNSTIALKTKSSIDFPEGVKVRVLDGFLKDSSIINEIKNMVEFTNLQKWE